MKPVTSMTIVKSSLFRRPLRSIGLSAVVALLCAAIFGGLILSSSMNRGLDTLEKRLGADVMVVRYGYESKAQGAILRGEPTTFYLDPGALDAISQVEGVAAASPQIYVATLSAGCCSYPLQLIGIDPATDFTVTPWITGQIKGALADGEIVVGSKISADVGSELQFFKRVYKVVGKLENTGMGFDTSIFMNITTAKQAAHDAARVSSQELQDNDDLISAVLVDVADGYDVKEVANNILRAHAAEYHLDTVVSDNMFNEVSSSIRNFTSYIRFFEIMIAVLTVLILLIVFSVTINSRRAEFSMYRVIGATKGRIFSLILLESFVISIIGAFIGIVVMSEIIFPFSNAISQSIGVPFLMPSVASILSAAAVSVLAAVICGPGASALCAAKFTSKEVYSTMREVM